MWDWLNERIADFEKKHIIDPGNEYLKSQIGAGLAELGKDVWVWFVDVLPDIAGYGTFAAGAFMMIAPAAGRGLLKPFAILAGGLILSVCILATN